MSEYDLRQYRLMLECVRLPISDMNLLLKMVDRLQALISVLEEKDREWLSKFTTQWWILEEIYAIYASGDSISMDENSINNIDKACHEIAELIEIKIRELSNCSK